MTSVAITYDVAAMARRLEESLATLEWAISLVPERWHHALPEQAPAGAWHAAMNLAHMTVYEERVAGPVLEAMRAGEDGPAATATVDEAAYHAEESQLAAEPVERILRRLRAARGRQVAVVRSFPEDLFNTPLTPAWGKQLHSAGWVATKTFQHTWEHGNSILRIALFVPP